MLIAPTSSRYALHESVIPYYRAAAKRLEECALMREEEAAMRLADPASRAAALEALEQRQKKAAEAEAEFKARRAADKQGAFRARMAEAAAAAGGVGGNFFGRLGLPSTLQQLPPS